jgi:hypothetical protein
MHGSHGALPELIPNEPEFSVNIWLPRPSSVYLEFIEAIKEKRETSNNFDVASKVTEIMLLANIAVAAQQLDITLEYDSTKMKIINSEKANDYFHSKYREGWKL